MPNQRNQTTRQRPPVENEFVPVSPTRSQPGELATGLDDTRDRAKSLLDQAKSAAGEAYDTVAEKATSTIEEKKTSLTGGLTTVADGMRMAGDSLSRSTNQNYVTEYSAQYARTAAKKLEQAARYFETKDLKAMARDAEDYARRNPAIFLGGAFVLGVLAARFFKSSPNAEIADGSIGPEHQLEPGNAGSIRTAETRPTAI